MQSLLKTFSLISLLVLLPFAVSQAENTERFVAGQDYAVLPTPVRTSDPNRIEVSEVFWYGCGHCYTFEASLKPWSASLKSDVNFVKIPAMWNDVMQIHAAMFYTAKQLNVLDKMHGGIFTAMHVEKKRFMKEAEVQKFFEEYGVDAETFKKTFHSFGINSQVKQADAKARSYQITGTPEMVVNGKYRVSARMTGSQPKMLEVVDFLIEKERAEKQAAQ